MKILGVAIAAAGSLALLVQIASVQAQTKWQKFQPSGAGYRIAVWTDLITLMPRASATNEP